MTQRIGSLFAEVLIFFPYSAELFSSGIGPLSLREGTPPSWPLVPSARSPGPPVGYSSSVRWGARHWGARLWVGRGAGGTSTSSSGRPRGHEQVGCGWDWLASSSCALIGVSDPGSGTSTIRKPEGGVTSFPFSSLFLKLARAVNLSFSGRLSSRKVRLQELPNSVPTGVHVALN